MNYVVQCMRRLFYTQRRDIVLKKIETLLVRVCFKKLQSVIYIVMNMLQFKLYVNYNLVS